MAKSEKKNKEDWIFWLALILSIIGICAVIVLALHALGLF